MPVSSQLALNKAFSYDPVIANNRQSSEKRTLGLVRLQNSLEKLASSPLDAWKARRLPDVTGVHSEPSMVGNLREWDRPSAGPAMKPYHTGMVTYRYGTVRYSQSARSQT